MIANKINIRRGKAGHGFSGLVVVRGVYGGGGWSVGEGCQLVLQIQLSIFMPPTLGKLIKSLESKQKLGPV